MKRICVVIIVLLCIVSPLSAQRGSASAGGEVEIVDARSVMALGKQWAVFIGIDWYEEWGPLQHPVQDALEIRDILFKKYYFEEDGIIGIYNQNATANGIRQLLVGLQKQVGREDSVFVFYAGHGHLDSATNTSFWIPSDGQHWEKGQANWLTSQQIRNMLTLIPAKHIFLISDSCFSGDILDLNRGATMRIDNDNYRKAYSLKSHQVMTRGGSVTVDDKSEFALRLKNTLQDAKAVCFDPEYLYSNVREVKDTQPLLGVIRDRGHQEGGSFLFFRRDTDNNRILPPPPSPPPLPQQLSKHEKGTKEFFIGGWEATVEHNNSFDTYEINLSANGRCTIKISNNTAEQETTGRWSWDGTIFKLDAVFKNAKIAYQNNVKFVFPVLIVDDNTFNILGKAATNGPQIRFTFYRE